MSTGYSRTIQQVVDACLREMGVNIQGGTASSTQVTDAITRLNYMLKRFFTLGLPYYREYKQTVTPFVAGTATYSISPDGSGTLGGVYEVYQAYLNNTTSNIRVPIRVISREEYRTYVNPTQQGRPVAVMLANDGLSCTFYLTPDSTTVTSYTAELYGYKQNDTFTAASDTITMPQEWYEAIHYGLCLRLSGEYGLSMENRNYLAGMARDSLEDAKNWNPQPGSIFFGVNPYGYTT